jgi:hypothetical protein
MAPMTKSTRWRKKNYDYHASMACRHVLAQKNELR